ncbi:MAG: monofunctional biosynthetic peptidoglycan transglycosylase [Candidatus Accumulibacter sp.]|jgi:monofunctional biosynthetic peptidoglycan transglycosylase|nr:monofunctional biosynthetic peptidoglycan transglycosylase [Accumulibacter sp.]
MRARLVAGIKRLLVLVVGIFLVYELWFFGWVLWWGRVDPGMTRFMEMRAAEIRAVDPARALKKNWVAYSAVSVHLKRALIASEDSKFLYHKGFDWQGIRHAAEVNARRGKVVAGGSTITQQLAKNLFLSPEKTPLRKLQEALITLMIESTWEKRRIFEVYINVIEWGDGVFGAEAAARHYFGVSAARLSPAQAACLAAMVPRPRYYEHHRDAQDLRRKSVVVLARMPLARIP